jgi:hypothetical protein
VEGITCGSCLTLNPPDAPACVRCNSTLSRAARVVPAVQPTPVAEPVEPVRSQPAQPAPARPARPRRPGRDDRLRALTPAAQRRIVRRIEIVGGVILLLLLVVGGFVVWQQRPRPIDTAAVAADIGGQLSQRLGQQVRVRCPEDAARRAGTTFDCTATDAAGDTRTVVVTVTGDDGAYRWQLR